MTAFHSHAAYTIMTAAQRLQELGHIDSVMPLLQHALNLDASLPSWKMAVHSALAAGEIEVALRFLVQAETVAAVEGQNPHWVMDYATRIVEHVKIFPELKLPVRNLSLASSLGIGSYDLVVGSIGTFSPYEGLDLLLDACTELVQSGEKLKLLLVGDSQPRIGDLAANIADTGLKETPPWLIQVGQVPHEHVADYYALLDAVVIPRKPLAVCELVPPMKAAEALAYGKRLVVSDVAPLAEYADKYDGVVSFEAGSAKSLATALQGSLKLPAPKPSTELLFSVHTEPMVRALKGEESAPVQKAVGEVQAKPTQSEPKPKAAAKSVAAAEPPPADETVQITPKQLTLNGNSKKTVSDIIKVPTPGATLELSAAVVYRLKSGATTRKSVLLFDFLDKQGNKIATLPGIAVAAAFKQHFRYLNANSKTTDAKPQEVFKLKLPEEVASVSLSVGSLGIKDNEQVELRIQGRCYSEEAEKERKRQLLQRQPLPEAIVHDPSQKRYTSDLTVACVLDEFTAECLSHEVTLIKVTQEAWQSQIEQNPPDFLLVESCWKGNDGNWGTITRGSGGGKKLSGLLRYCKQQGIPTVFWNKEDPPHYDKFGPIAKLFDLAITTDVNMVPRYKADFGIDVHPLSFGAQPIIHNPEPVIPRLPKAVFAGSYYGDKPKRCEDFNAVMGQLERANVSYDIFDRNYQKGIEKFFFPDHYQANIVGNLPPEEVWKAHKGYKYQVNMNSVQDSATMFARRVYESLASGTPVISNDSVGVRELFGDIVIMPGKQSIAEQLRVLEASPAAYHELARRGVHAVMREHTYGHRIRALCRLLGMEVEVDLPKVTLAVTARSEADIDRAKQLFAAQTAQRKHLFIELDNFDTAYQFLNASDDKVTYTMQLAHEFYADERQYYGSDRVLKHDVNAPLAAKALEDFLYWGAGEAPSAQPQATQRVGGVRMSQPTPKKVLVVSWHFPPYKSSSAFNLFKRLKDTGYEYDVLQIKRADKPDNEGMFRYASSRFNRYEIEVPTEDARDPEARAHYVEKVLDFYRRLKDHNHYRVMISHSHEIGSHLAAMAIKKANPELRWVASFGDPIAANPFNESYRFPMLEEDSRTEAEVLQQADRIIVTNPYQQAIVCDSQAQPVDRDKFFVLPHCFDERMYPTPAEQASRVPAQAEGEKVFRFMHVGMLYKFKRTAEPFMRGAQRLLEKHPELLGRFTLEFYGANDRYIQAAADYGLEGVASFKGTVSYLESLSVMTQSDCLLLRDADFSDQGLRDTPFYPGKLADYLGAKKPVLAVTMANGCVPDMLARLGGASLTEEDIDGIADAMWAAMQGRLTVNSEEAERYSHHQTAERARQALSYPEDKRKILIAGHDLKFAKFIMEAIEQRDDMELLIDQWQGHSKHDEEQSHRLLNQADTIFCEWGLGNAVWYSRHKKAGQRLVTRLHLQEITTRHPVQFKHEAIDAYIMVSPYWFETFVHEFSLERKKCKMVYNLVDTELLDKPKTDDAKFHLGMIGDVPQRKRLDRALDIFEKLYAQDKRYKLFVKGKRPEDYPWMHSAARKPEMDYYRAQYQRIEDNGWQDNVIFEGHGPIDIWLQKIGYMLSVSDFESFHLAPAEGMASGALPIVFNWEGARTIYPDQCVYRSVDEACNAVLSDMPMTAFAAKHYVGERFSKPKNTSSIVSLMI